MGWPLAWVVGGLSLGLLTAGLVSPRVGDSIERHGGRPVLAVSAALLASGLAGLALAPSLLSTSHPGWCWASAWALVSTMPRSRRSGGSTVNGHANGDRHADLVRRLCQHRVLAAPRLAGSEFGWRGACLVYAGIHLAVVLPLYMFALPREPRRHVATSAPRTARCTKAEPRGRCQQGRCWSSCCWPPPLPSAR